MSEIVGASNTGRWSRLSVRRHPMEENRTLLCVLAICLVCLLSLAPRMAGVLRPGPRGRC